MRIVFYCPAVIGFAASLVEEIKEIAEIIVTGPREVLSALSALSAGHYYLMHIVFYCPAEIKEIKEIMLPSLCAALSAISAISAGHYYLMRIVFYCPAVIGFAASLVEEIKEIQVSDVALGRPSASILQGKELPRPT